MKPLNFNFLMTQTNIILFIYIFLRLNNHRKDANSISNNMIPASKHFHDSNYLFNQDTMFTIIEQIKNTQNTKQEKRLKRENFWINKLQIMTPIGLNRELNNV